MHSLALLLALLTFADQPITVPPEGVIIPPAKPGDPPLHLTVPYNPNAADKADLDALASEVKALSGRVDVLAKSVANRTRAQAMIPHVAECAVVPPPAAPKGVPKAAAPTLYRLTDASGQTWTHADPVWLRTYVSQRNAQRVMPTYAYPSLYGGCAGGNCSR